MIKKILAVFVLFGALGLAASKDGSPLRSTNLVFCELGGSREYDLNQVADANAVLAQKLREYKLDTEWIAYIVPLRGSYRIVFIPLYQGYDLADILRDKILSDVEQLFRRTLPK